MILCSLTAISAADNNETAYNAADTDVKSITDTVSSTDQEIYGDSSDENIATQKENVASKTISKNTTNTLLTSSGNAFYDLQDIIDKASPGSTVYLDKDYLYIPTLTAFSQTLEINKALTIDGQGHALDADKYNRIIKVTADNVVIKNIRLLNGYEPNDYIVTNGVSVRWSGNNGKMENCTMINSLGQVTLLNSYGGIYVSGSGMTISSCRFENNQAYIGGSIYLNSNNNKVVNCSFTRNKIDQITSSYGSGIYINGKNNLVDNCNFWQNTCMWGLVYINNDNNIIRNCKFSHDQSLMNFGGYKPYKYTAGIEINSKGNTIENCLFYSERGKYGSAIYIHKNSNTIKNNVFAKNYASNDENSGDPHGGAIYCDASNVTIEKNVFYFNGCDDKISGDIYSAYEITVKNNWFLNTKDNRFENRYSVNNKVKLEDNVYLDYEVDEASLMNMPSMVKLQFKTIKSSKLVSFTDKHDEFEVYAVNGTITTDISSVSDAKSEIKTTLNGDPTVIYYIPKSGPSGQITLVLSDEAKPLTMTIKIRHKLNNTISSLNKAIQNSDTVNLTQDYEFMKDYDDNHRTGIKITRNTTINGNGHTIDAKLKSRIFDVSEGVTLTLNNVSVINEIEDPLTNTTVYSYDDLYNELIYATLYSDIESYTINLADGDYNATKAIYKSLFNYVYYITINGNGHTIDGNGIHSFLNMESYHHTITLKNLIIQNFVGNTIAASTLNLIIDNCTFINNTASGNGGVISHTNGKKGVKTLSINNSIFKDNTAGGDGGAIYALDTPNVIINNSTFENNKAGGDGGAIKLKDKKHYDKQHKSIITNTTFTNNTAKNNGGAVCHEIALTVKDSSFINNSATTAGAIYRDATSNLYNNTFSGNTPRKFEPQNGTFTDLYKLIKNATGELTLEHDYVFTPTVDYGLINGIYINKPLTINGDGYTISGHNDARIFHVKADNVIIKNIVLRDGKTDSKGGAIYWNGKNGVIDNSTLTNNIANMGGAIYVVKRNVTISNNNFTKNYARNSGGAVYAAGYGTNLKNNLFQHNQAKKGLKDRAVYYNLKTSVKNYKNNTYINNTPFKYGGNEGKENTNKTPKQNQQTATTRNTYGQISNTQTGNTYEQISKITVNDREIPIYNNLLLLETLNAIFNIDFTNGHLLVYIDGELVFNATTTDDLTQVIYNLLNLLRGNHEIKVEFTDKEGKTNTYTENITV